MFATLEDFVERSSALIGSPQQVIDKVHRYHEQFGHSVLHLHADAGGLTHAQHRASLELFQSDIAPVLRRTSPTRRFLGLRSSPVPNWPGPVSVPASGTRAHRPLRSNTRPWPASLSESDLVPIPSGSTAGEALRNTIDLAQQAERFGYTRYWFAEHHLNPGVAGTSPAVVLALTASATSTIRIGSGAVQLGHRTALSTVEEFGLIDALHPGPTRPGPRPFRRHAPPGRRQAARPTTTPVVDGRDRQRAEDPATVLLRAPARFARFALQQQLLHQPGAEPPDYGEQVDDILALLPALPFRGRARSARVPGEGADVQVWILGSSGGESAERRRAQRPAFRGQLPRQPGHRAGGRRGLPCRFPAIRPSGPALCQRLRRRCRRRGRRDGPGTGHRLRAVGSQHPHRPRARSPSRPRSEARAHAWSEADRALVADRVDTQFVGSPGTVADQLEQLQDATGADELIITTITHDHADRVRSYRLLAEEWQRR